MPDLVVTRDAVEAELTAAPPNDLLLQQKVRWLRDLQGAIATPNSAGGLTQAEVEAAIEAATNLDNLETLLTAVRDRLISGGPALNMGTANTAQRVVDAASSFTTANVGNYDGTFTTSGTSAVAAQNIQSIDLTNQGRSEFSLSLTCTGNATAPGAASTITFYYAFSPDAGATIGQFRGFTTLPVMSLANLANFVNRFTTQRIVPTAQFFYLWHDRSALPAGTTISIQARINNT